MGRLFSKSEPAGPVGAVFFDIGGVVVLDYSYTYVGPAAKAFDTKARHLLDELKKYHAKLETGQMKSADAWMKIGKSLHKQKLGRPISPKRCQNLWNELLEGKLRLDEEVVEICQKLAGGPLRLGALTNVIPEHYHLIKTLGVYDLFEITIASFEEGTRKPKRKIYQKAAQAFELDCSQCLFIDDSFTNVEGAEKAGMIAHHYEEVAELHQFLDEHVASVE